MKKQGEPFRRQVRGGRSGLLRFRIRNAWKRRFSCPICGYRGPFEDLVLPTGRRRHARCPSCGSLERHRLQFLVLGKVYPEGIPPGSRVLHVAPEEFFRPLLRGMGGRYYTADLHRTDVDLRLDLGKAPFPSGWFDCIFASHVLEHIPDDRHAIREIRRILGTGGIALLPVPVVVEKTVEYPAPNPFEAGHVRAPGLDYFERLKSCFQVELYSSSSFPGRYQTFIHEDRSGWPSRECPLRTPMEGRRHEDFVPVCRVAGGREKSDSSVPGSPGTRV